MPSAPAAVPAISAITLRFFTRIVRSYFRRHFRAVLIQQQERLRDAPAGPLIVYANHASWWDPMVSVLLAQTLLPARRHYAPMDAAPLARYPILRKIGIFPIEPATPRGAVEFLRTSEAVLRAGGVLWVTPQGRFADAREPLVFKAGLAALIERVPEATVIPLALEYTFWNERLPETLLRVGEPMRAVDLSAGGDVNAALVQALAVTMHELKTGAIARDPLLFTPLLEGARGTGGLYALGRRLRALLRGEGFEEDHSARDRRVQDAMQPEPQPQSQSQPEAKE
jgi:1-acyl-sn-glycerol-3-phosphate acyltransferase